MEKSGKKDKTFDEIVKEAYEVLNLFQDYSCELRPNYLTAETKKATKAFHWNFENFKEKLKEGVNREGKNVFEDLGYSISFFSSMNDLESCGFLMCTGNKKQKFYNSLIIELPISLNLYDKKAAEMISNLFEKLVQVYEPFFGCVSNKALIRKYGRYLNENLPATVDWINYWSEDILCTVGMHKIQKLVERNPEVVLKNGILKIKDTAINLEEEADIKYHDELHEQLFL